MAVSYNPSIVRDGLILNLDAANSKSVLFNVEVLLVAGGGAGGGRHAGGGGGGGVIYNPSYPLNPGVAYTVTVGAGGSGFALNSGYGGRGNNGGNSVFDTLTALGGGGGGGYADGLATVNGANGGSGGGAAMANGLPGGNGSPGSGTAGQGFGGGSANTGSSDWAAGGGGGAGGIGLSSQSGSPLGGNGGPGRLFSISGTPTYYAGGGGGGGGGGGSTTNGGIGGIGGGGNGNSSYNPNQGTAGTPNTGGGGGGSRDQAGASGGSGIVIVRYYGAQRASGGTVTSVNGYTIHTFTSVGSTTFTPNSTWYDVSGSNTNATKGGTQSPTYPLYNSNRYFTFTGGVNGNNYSRFEVTTPTLTAISVIAFHYSTASGGHVLRHSTDSFQLGVDGYAAGTAYNNIQISGDLTNTLNTWVCDALTFNGITLVGYRNGVQVGTTARTLTTIAGGTLNIGTRSDQYAAHYVGNIAVVLIYNRALSASEIQQNFNALRGRFSI